MKTEKNIIITPKAEETAYKCVAWFGKRLIPVSRRHGSYVTDVKWNRSPSPVVACLAHWNRTCGICTVFWYYPGGALILEDSPNNLELIARMKKANFPDLNGLMKMSFESI